MSPTPKASKPGPFQISSLHVRYDLEATLAEAKSDFSPETGSQRLLQQSEISARFRKTDRNSSRSSK
ncbi:MAG: hypothetical protein Q8J74_07130 [Candidatus Didemnitutus sp.]|nr:hypothetical protein [Candidatus Didemnitutus sp.]